jgi:DNA-binding YbaB/EbfC family protein
MFDKMKQLYDLQKQAREAQKAAADLKVEKKSRDGKISVLMNGTFHVESLSIDSSLLAADQKLALERSLLETFNEAADEAGKQSAAQAMDLMKKMNIKLPGF